jgi:hypothetical protein
MQAQSSLTWTDGFTFTRETEWRKTHQHAELSNIQSELRQDLLWNAYNAEGSNLSFRDTFKQSCRSYKQDFKKELRKAVEFQRYDLQHAKKKPLHGEEFQGLPKPQLVSRYPVSLRCTIVHEITVVLEGQISCESGEHFVMSFTDVRC